MSINKSTFQCQYCICFFNLIHIFFLSKSGEITNEMRLCYLFFWKHEKVSQTEDTRQLKYLFKGKVEEQIKYYVSF